MLLVAFWLTCVAAGAVLMSIAKRPIWEGALAALVFGPVGVLIALYVVLKGRRAAV